MIDTRPQTSTEQLPAAAIAALHQGNKIEAIKIVRQERGIGLKEAKDAVDLYVQISPEETAALVEPHGFTRKGRFDLGPCTYLMTYSNV